MGYINTFLHRVFSDKIVLKIKLKLKVKGSKNEIFAQALQNDEYFSGPTMSPCMRDIIGGSRILCSCIWLISYVAFCGIIEIENVVYHKILASFGAIIYRRIQPSWSFPTCLNKYWKGLDNWRRRG